MKKIRHLTRARLGLLALALGFAQAANAGNLTQQQLTKFAADAKLNFSVVSNFAAKAQIKITIANE